MTQKIVNHSTKTKAISNFTKERYVSGDYFSQEWENLWLQTWLFAGLEQDVSEPGDYFVFEIGQESILVSRSKDGGLHAFYNVCQHRGNRLVQTGQGNTDGFRCAYHAWTYETDGSVRSIPDRNKFSLGTPCEKLSLKPVQVDVWDGLIFVSMSDNPPSLATFLGPIVELLAPYKFKNMVVTEDQTVHHYCNWKAIIDNFSELYHVDYIHPQHQRFVDCCNDQVDLFPYGHTGVIVEGATVNPRYPIPNEPTDILTEQLKNLDLNPDDFNGRVPDIRRAVQLKKREIGKSRGYDYADFSDEQLSDIWQFNLFPNIILSFTPESCWILRPRPHPTDPQQCYFDKITLTLFPDPKLQAEASTEDKSGIAPGGREHEVRHFMPGHDPLSDYTRPERDVFDHHAILNGEKSMTITIDQDIHLLGGVQAGMRSKGFDQVWLNDDEIRIQHFHSAIDDMMDAG